MKGFCLPVQVNTLPPHVIAVPVLLTLVGVSVACLALVASPWIVALSLVQLLVVSPVLKDWFDYRKFVNLYIGTDCQAMWFTRDGRLLKDGLCTLLNLGSWVLIIVQVHKRGVPLVVRRPGNEEHFHRLRLLAREL